MNTLAISNTVEFSVKLSIKDGGVLKPFAFTLVATRLEQDEISAKLDNKEGLSTDFLKEVVTGWKGQRLVLDDEGQPAEFSPEGLAAMLRVTGLANVCFNAYLKEVVAKEKN